MVSTSSPASHTGALIARCPSYGRLPGCVSWRPPCGVDPRCGLLLTAFPRRNCYPREGPFAARLLGRRGLALGWSGSSRILYALGIRAAPIFWPSLLLAWVCGEKA